MLRRELWFAEASLYGAYIQYAGEHPTRIREIAETALQPLANTSKPRHNVAHGPIRARGGILVEERLPRKLAAILYADVAGYSRLTGEDEEGTHRRLSEYLDLISDAIEKHQGKVVHYAGDAVLADFGTVTEALTCATATQCKLADLNLGLPDERKVQFRIGLNLGEVIVDRDDIYGDGVNVAARLEGLAEPGGVCISGTIYDAIGNKLSTDYEFLGEKKVKNIARPLRVYRVILDAEPKAREELDGSTDADPSDQLSIAVLPFTNMSPDSNEEYFADGVTEGIITDLSTLSELLFIARSSTFTYKGKATKVQQIGHELGARYILEGSIQKAAARVRVSVQLIDVTTGYHLWAERYDRELSDIFALQDDVTEKIVSALKVRLAPGETGRLRTRGTKNIEAYDYLLRAKEYASRLTKEANVKSRQIYEKALEIEPTSAAAYAGLAGSHLMDWSLGWSDSPQESLERAMPLAKRAIELDDLLASPHAVLCRVYLWKKMHADAVREGERAIALEPNDADNIFALGTTLGYVGSPEQAMSLIERAMRLDPKRPANYLFALGHAHFLTGRYERAAEALERASIRNPDFRPTYPLLAASYACMGQRDRAERVRDACVKVNPDITIAMLSGRVPYRRESDMQRFINSMREAGWPE